MDNYREFVNGFVKQCQSRGINDPGVIASLLKETERDMQVKKAAHLLTTDRHVVQGFIDKCASIGIVDQTAISKLLKLAEMELKAKTDTSKMYPKPKIPKGKTHVTRR